MTDYHREDIRQIGYKYYLEEQFTNWDPDKFDWSYSLNLATECSEYINIWWDSEKFAWFLWTWALIMNCSKDFKIWWDPDRFNWEFENNLLNLKKYCSKHKHIWEPDYLIWKLKQ